MKSTRRRICFVTGTRAEFGLMQSALRKIADHKILSLQIVATGMHLDRSRGDGPGEIRAAGWKIDSVVPWPSSSYSQSATAIATGQAIAGLAQALDTLNPDIVLVTGDRVEAFAAASAAHIGGRLVAHVHGGDRAMGLVDDSLRHAVTKLSHIHFPATSQSARRIERLGEDRWRIFRVGSPGLDGIRAGAASWKEVADEFPGLVRRRYALVILHPQTAQGAAEFELADQLLGALDGRSGMKAVVIYPNNDPGSAGIVRRWDAIAQDGNAVPRRNLVRRLFLGLLRDAAIMVGNSSSGIIEAASFGTPVIDLGHRQTGRERGKNVIHVDAPGRVLMSALDRLWRGGGPVRFPINNPYGPGRAGPAIVRTLSSIPLDRFRRKLIAY